jgi:hypothetical protein
MRENVFTFGDMIFKQLTGTAMGTPPACALATIYMAINGENDFINDFSGHLKYYRRFIDDAFGVWECHPDPAVDQHRFQQFILRMQTAPGLEWIVEPLSTQVNFLDLTISILPNCTFTTTLYEKDLNLHLYIPPSSAHPPGLLPGLVFGNLFRIHTLCTDEVDKYNRTKLFYDRLAARGYQPQQLLPIFQKAITRAKSYTGPTERPTDRLNAIIFHVQYHPQDPPSYLIQQAWRQHLAEPLYKLPLKMMQNPCTKIKPGIDRLIIAYSRPMNLGNLLSHRELTHPNYTGPQVSAYHQPLGVI